MDFREKAKLLAYVLWGEFNAKQANIAKVLNVSESTISLWLKEMRLRTEIRSLKQELAEVRCIAQGMMAQRLLEYRQSFDVFQ